MLHIIYTIIAAIIGALLAKKLRFPAPFMIGAMLGVAVLNSCFDNAYMPASTKIFTQSISGAYIGLSISRQDVKMLKHLALPSIILILCFLVFTTVVGLLLYSVFHFDLSTSFLVAIPGGVTEITLMSEEMGAVPSTISFMQTFRLFFVYMCFPSIIMATSKKHVNETVEQIEIDNNDYNFVIDKYIPNSPVLCQILVVIVALLSGYLGKLSRIPAGTLSFSLIVITLLRLNSNKIFLDKKYKRYTQIIAGSLVGSTIGMATLLHITDLILPTLVLISGYVLSNFIISYAMAKTKQIDYISAMFASSPGGASDMALIASEIGGDSPKIAIIQIIRLISCYTVFPMWVKFLVEILS